MNKDLRAALTPRDMPALIASERVELRRRLSADNRMSWVVKTMWALRKAPAAARRAVKHAA